MKIESMKTLANVTLIALVLIGTCVASAEAGNEGRHRGGNGRQVQRNNNHRQQHFNRNHSGSHQKHHNFHGGQKFHGGHKHSHGKGHFHNEHQNFHGGNHGFDKGNAHVNG